MTTARVRTIGIMIALLLAPALASAQWETPNRAFHKATIFPLEGRHLGVPCASCHIRGQVKGTPTGCADCHWVRRQDDPYKTRLGIQCEQCHRATSWTAVVWDHGTQAGMPLNLAHRTLSCDTCHRNGLFTGVNLSCGTCHAQEYAQAKKPDHLAAGFPTDCELCHLASDETFSQGRFDHNATFSLVGVHATVDCASCHGNGVYQGTPRDCIGCHRTDFERTTSPNHVAAGYSTQCETCHRATDASWRAGKFNHASAFALVGVHATLTCTTCHVNNVFQGTPRDCVGCHRSDYDRTTSPNHAASGFSTECDSCHRPTDGSWQDSNFNHQSVFPLVGVHATQACTACHVNGVFKGTPRDCVGCHRADYDRTTSPNHAKAGYSTACDSCHRPTDASWQNAHFAHASIFPLVGVHATQACTACHVNGVFKGTPRDCVGCHRADYDRTTSPNHAAAGFPTTCDSCHRASDSSWQNGGFDHNSVYQLLGVHATIACGLCHVNNVYKGTPRDCYPCHQAQYQQTTNPNHVGAGFPTTCEVCHKASDSSWNQGRFTHSWFPITSGRHSGIDCATCHTNPSAFAQFSCLNGCHSRSTTDSHHRGVSGYAYDSNRCYACHPTGRGD